jgi:hypothetical protein
VNPSSRLFFILTYTTFRHTSASDRQNFLKQPPFQQSSYKNGMGKKLTCSYVNVVGSGEEAVNKQRVREERKEIQCGLVHDKIFNLMVILYGSPVRHLFDASP